MDIFPILYVFLQLILLPSFLLVKGTAKLCMINVVATLNMMLFFNGLYLMRKLIGLIQFFRPIIEDTQEVQFSSNVFLEPTLRIGGMVFLPFIFLFPFARKNSIVTFFICAYILLNYNANFISVFDTMLKCFFCISVFTVTYSILWFFKNLPSQTIAE